MATTVEEVVRRRRQGEMTLMTVAMENRRALQAMMPAIVRKRVKRRHLDTARIIVQALLRQI
jgi:hypothetical protein